MAAIKTGDLQLSDLIILNGGKMLFVLSAAFDNTYPPSLWLSIYPSILSWVQSIDQL